MCTVIIIENLPRQVYFFCTGRFSGACWLNRQVLEKGGFDAKMTSILRLWAGFFRKIRLSLPVKWAGLAITNPGRFFTTRQRYGQVFKKRAGFL